jgi:cation diffusion facilitator CzcD-associated flavoprotein CzcO
MSEFNVDNPHDIDLDALRLRYRDERDVRLRQDGSKQYRDVSGKYAKFDEDPYVERIEREPLNDLVDVVIVGGGWSGLMAAVKLKQAGIDKVRIIEKGGDFGGVWYWNRYPGAQCDIESYIYTPLLDDTGYMPTEKYIFQPELFAYAQSLGQQFELYKDAVFQTELQEVRWDEEQGVWVLQTNRGDQMRTKFMVMTTGPLSRPKLPGIPGLDDFQGHIFHTSRWDYEYTGGDTNGNLSGLADKKVGILGTGATAIQSIPHLGASAGELFVFQRTPSVVLERNNRPTDPEWAASLEPGWYGRRQTNFNVIVTGGHQDEDLVDDMWTYICSKVTAFGKSEPPPGVSLQQHMLDQEIKDAHLMAEVRARIDRTVHDPATADSLKPWYRLLCKRPTFHDTYLPTFNRPNVHLVDTHGRGVERATEKGLVVDGVEYELDCLILATGFDTGSSYTERQAYDVVGRNGVKLSDKWGQGYRTFHGFYTNGFPNLFFMGGTQKGGTPNVPHSMRVQAEHISWVISQIRVKGADVVEANLDAEQEWDSMIRAAMSVEVSFLTDCTPGYFNNEGKPYDPKALRFGGFPHGSEVYFQLLRDWRDEGELAGLTVQTIAGSG